MMEPPIHQLEEKIKLIASNQLFQHYYLRLAQDSFPIDHRFQEYAIKSFKFWLMTRCFANSPVVSTASIPCLITKKIWMSFKNDLQYSHYCKRFTGHELRTGPEGSIISLPMEKETLQIPKAIVETYNRLFELKKLFPQYLRDCELLFSVDNELGIREGFAYSPQVMQSIANYMEINSSSTIVPEKTDGQDAMHQDKRSQNAAHFMSQLATHMLDFGSTPLNNQYQSIVKKTMELHQHPLVTSHPPHQHLMHGIIHNYLPTVWKLHDKINSYKAWDTLVQEKSLHKTKQQLNTIEQMLTAIEQQVLEDFFRQQKTMNLFLQSKINSLSHPKA